MGGSIVNALGSAGFAQSGADHISLYADEMTTRAETLTVLLRMKEKTTRRSFNRNKERMPAHGSLFYCTKVKNMFLPIRDVKNNLPIP